MLKRLFSLFKTLYYRMLPPMKVADLHGVKYGRGCHFMTKRWDSESYLIEMGDNVQTSANVTFVTHDGSMRVIRNLYPQYEKADLFGRIKIGNNVFIGINATILPGTEIGDNVIIGAGSVVKGKIKSNGVYAGVPARFICTIEEYVQKHKQNYDYTKGMNPEEKKRYLKAKYDLRHI